MSEATDNPAQQTLTIQQAIDLAVQHHNAGRLPEAENVYNQILQAEPNQPVVLHLLGVIAHQVGKNEVAVGLIGKALAIKPDYAEAHSNLGNALQEQGKLDDAIASYNKALTINPNYAEVHSNLGSALQEQGKLDDAIASYNKALAINPNYAEAHSNLGNALQKQGKLDDAVASFHKALAIDPNYAEAHSNLGSALQEQGKLDDAIASYNKALAIDPNYADAHNNLGSALHEQGKLDDAVASYNKALAINPNYADAHNNLILHLNYHTPASNYTYKYVKAQMQLQKVQLPITCGEPISDDTIAETYQRCEAILKSQQLPLQTNLTQIYRGEVYERNCDRHKHVFDTQNIIAEFCFGCFKVAITPRTVTELFKLNAVFDNLVLPTDNTRKCHIEMRPEIPGAYKGLIYCLSLSEAQEIVSLVQPVVNSLIDKDIPISIKRGCSEFPLAYPDYGHVGENGSSLMTYDSAWKVKEALANNNFIESKNQLIIDTHNHQGQTIQDVLIMRSWLKYAAAIGDLSYLKVSGAPLDKLNIEGREPFQNSI